MATSRQKRQQRIAQAGVTKDSFQNVAARLGIGTNNIASGGAYAINPITRQRAQLEWMYRGSWIVGQAVDCVAEDMTRAGISLTSTVEPDDVENIHAGFRRRAIWQNLNSTTKWARLYGGAIAVMLIDGQDLSTPLRMDTIAKGSFKGILVLDRWTVAPAVNDMVADFGPDLGKPRFYDVMISAPALQGERIHYSRVIRMDGIDLPHWQRIAEYGWGLSIVERLYDRLLAFDSSTQGVAQLVYKAHLRTVSVDGLRDILAQGGPAEQGLIKMFEMIRLMQSNEGLTLLDGKDKFEAHSFTFSGLSDVLLQFAQQISGALQIPLVRLFGQSPAGLNSTGDADIRTYYDSIAQQQESRLRHGVGKLIDLVYRADIGRAPPDDLSFTFNPLWQMSDKEKVEIASTVTTTVTAAFESGLIDESTALKEMRQASQISGIWTNITDEDITAAEASPPLPQKGSADEPPTPDA